MGDHDHTATSAIGRRPVQSLAVDPRGLTLASASDGSVRLWDTATGSLRAALDGHGGPVRAVAISPDGTYLASAGDDGSVRLWDTATGSLRAALDGHGGPVRAVAISPDGTYLASAGDDGSVRLWDTATGSLRAALDGHGGPVRAVAISPDGTYLASAGDDGSVRLWDTATGSLRAALDGHGGPVRAVAISPDGTYLASAGDDGSVRLWDTATGSLRAALDGHGGPVRAVAISPDGTYLASAGDDGSVRLWDTATGSLRAALDGHGGPVRAVAISPDGTYLASAGDDGSVRLWDTATGSLISTYQSGPTAFVSYSREDWRIADLLRRLLSEAGLAVWTDQKIPVGSSIAGQIERAIRSADAIFFVSSPLSSESPAVNAELAMAVAERNRNPRKVIIPVPVGGGGRSISPLLRDMARLDIESEEHAADQIVQLARQLYAGDSISLQRTPQDREAQFKLIRSELDAIASESRSYTARLGSRERSLRAVTVLGAMLIIIVSLGILAALLEANHHSASAWLLTGTNIAATVSVVGALLPATQKFMSSKSVSDRRGADDDS